VDDNVGRVLDWLDAHQLSRNTLVIYTSDQGFFLGEHGMYDKRFMYEESIRMPLLMRWPGHIQKQRTNQRLVVNTDFAPTFLELAGVPVPSDIQGRSLVPILMGQQPPEWRKSFYYRYYHDPGHHNTRAHLGVRTDRYKLIHFWKKDQWECYDLLKDPNELHNLYDDPKSQKIVAELKVELARLKTELEDHDEFADSQPPDGVDGAPKKWKPGYKP
jgi:arylsulfatase A-like enzyme